MRDSILGIAAFLGVFAMVTSAVPLYEDEIYPYEFAPQEYYSPHGALIQVRERRSPQQQPRGPPPPPPPRVNIPPPPKPIRGSFDLSGGHTSGSGGFVRGEYNHKLWENKNGARIDANTYYQRNWGGGPRQDYGGGVKLSVPLGGRRH